jgi:hypothetical protein
MHMGPQIFRMQSIRSIPDGASHNHPLTTPTSVHSTVSLALLYRWLCSPSPVFIRTSDRYQPFPASNLTYSPAVCVRPLVMLTRRFVRQIPACKEGPNLKTKDLWTHIYMNLYRCFWMYNWPLKFVRLISNHPVYVSTDTSIRIALLNDSFRHGYKVSPDNWQFAPVLVLCSGTGILWIF